MGPNERMQRVGEETRWGTGETDRQTDREGQRQRDRDRETWRHRKTTR